LLDPLHRLRLQLSLCPHQRVPLHAHLEALSNQRSTKMALSAGSFLLLLKFQPAYRLRLMTRIGDRP
jgi:hypothetical protein